MNSSKIFDFDPEAVKMEFREWLSSLPCPPHDVNGLNLDDGKNHRFRIADEAATKKSGEFQLHLDGFPAGWAKNYRSGDFQKWKYQSDHPTMTADERKEFAKQCDAQRVKHEVEQAKELQPESIGLGKSGRPRRQRTCTTWGLTSAKNLSRPLMARGSWAKILSSHSITRMGNSSASKLFN